MWDGFPAPSRKFNAHSRLTGAECLCPTYRAYKAQRGGNMNIVQYWIIVAMTLLFTYMWVTGWSNFPH